MRNDNLGDRMKNNYENVTRTYLTRRTPVIIRLDGRSFHTFTRGLDKPFDAVMVQTMQDTMKYLCENIEGCVLGYTQSDEITLVLCDYKTLTSQAWFDNNIQKMCSISASMATLAFNSFFRTNVIAWNADCYADMDATCLSRSRTQYDKYASKFDKAMFDSRVFNIPKEEVNNCLLWRQQDAIRNSIQSVAQANFPHKELEGKSCKQLQEKLETERGIIWEDYPIHLKRGSCCVKSTYTLEVDGKDVRRSEWVIDNEIPIFSQNTWYVNGRITFDE